MQGRVDSRNLCAARRESPTFLISKLKASSQNCSLAQSQPFNLLGPTGFGQFMATQMLSLRFEFLGLLVASETICHAHEHCVSHVFRQCSCLRQATRLAQNDSRSCRALADRCLQLPIGRGRPQIAFRGRSCFGLSRAPSRFQRSKSQAARPQRVWSVPKPLANKKCARGPGWRRTTPLSHKRKVVHLTLSG